MYDASTYRKTKPNIPCTEMNTVMLCRSKISAAVFFFFFFLHWKPTHTTPHMQCEWSISIRLIFWCCQTRWKVNVPGRLFWQNFTFDVYMYVTSYCLCVNARWNAWGYSNIWGVPSCKKKYNKTICEYYTSQLRWIWSTIFAYINSEDIFKNRSLHRTV